MTVDNMNTVMSGRTGVNFTVRPMTLENPALIKAAQESSSLFNMPIEDLLLDAKYIKRLEEWTIFSRG